jgi:predicted DCC family thiol-disulfide oxidoreductase YuxK
MATFLYDGDCNFCVQLAKYWQGETYKNNLEFDSFRKYTESELMQLHPSLSIEKCEGEVQLIYKNKRLSGFFAVRRMMFWSKTFRYVAPVLYLPLVPFLGMLTMFLLKKIRTKL